MREQVFANATVVLADDTLAGAVQVRDGRIAALDAGACRIAGAIDCAGDLLIPGLIELHTDNLETHMLPRPKAHWPSVPAVVSHDAQVVGAGITTVFDALALGTVRDDSEDLRIARLTDMTEGLAAARADDLLKAEHFLHLRCEIAHPRMRDLFDATIESPFVRLLSVMDHTPGQRQFASLEAYAYYYKNKHGLSEVELGEFMTRRQADQQQFAAGHRRHVVAEAKARGLCLASHDDATEAHVAEAVADGMAIAEFPTTEAAARAAHGQGLAVLMGGPNLVRGGSHSGNVSAAALAEAGVLDILSSDYAPASLLHAAMMLADMDGGVSLPRAIATVTRAPARACGLDDRGEIAVGKRADLVRVRRNRHTPSVRAVWRAGERIA